MAVKTAKAFMIEQADPHLAMRSIDITVADLDATIDYYGAAMPLREIRRFALPTAAFGRDLVTCRDGKVKVAVVAVPTGILNFMQFPRDSGRTEPLPVIGPGYTHMCIQSPADDPALPKLMRQGLGMVSRCDERGVDIGGYGVRYAYGRDPEGRMLEVEMLDRPRRSERGWITHIANVVHDHARMMDFYARLLGRQPYRTIAQSNRPTLDDVAGIDGIGILGGWFRVHNLEIEVWTFTSPATPAPRTTRKLDDIGYNAFSLEVADLATETDRLESIGVSLVGPEIDFGGWRSRYASDPEGNLICIQSGGNRAESGLQFTELQH